MRKKNRIENTYKTFVSLTEEEKNQFEYICQEENRNKSDMIKYFIKSYYKKLQQENDGVVIKNPTPEDYEKLMSLRGSGWEGDLNEMRKGRVFDNDNS